MKFWDASAIVPLCLTEPQSAVVKTILVKDTSLVVWWATRTECVSALVRQTREAGLSLDDEKKARQVLGVLAKVWLEVRPTETLRLAAERLLAVHPLRAADGFQLAAALQWCQRETQDASFVSFDVRLREAAYKEGFDVLPGAAS